MTMTQEEKQARVEERRAARKAEKEALKIQAEKDQKPVKSITISIEWKKSRTWGNNPHAMAEVRFRDGSFIRQDGYTCSGCGYDKESTVIAAIFDDFLKYKLWMLSKKRVKGENTPYGICNYSPGSRNFSGGIGTSCYYPISEYIGGNFKHVASGKTFDVFEYTDKRQKP